MKKWVCLWLGYFLGGVPSTCRAEGLIPEELAIIAHWLVEGGNDPNSDWQVCADRVNEWRRSVDLSGERSAEECRSCWMEKNHFGPFSAVSGSRWRPREEAAFTMSVRLSIKEGSRTDYIDGELVTDVMHLIGSGRTWEGYCEHYKARGDCPWLWEWGNWHGKRSVRKMISIRLPEREMHQGMERYMKQSERLSRTRRWERFLPESTPARTETVDLEELESFLTPDAPPEVEEDGPDFGCFDDFIFDL